MACAIDVPILTRSEAASLCLLSLPDPDRESEEGPGSEPVLTTGVPGVDIGESRALSNPLRPGVRMRDSTRSSTSLRATEGPVDLSKVNVSITKP